MEDLSTADLVLVHLADAEESVEARTTSAISDALNVGAAVSARIDLLSTIADLREAGLIEARPLHADDDGPTACELTDAGRARASDLLDRLDDETVALELNGGRRQVSLELARDRRDAASIAAVVARTTDGVLRAGTVDPDAFVDRTAELERIESALADGDAGDVGAIRLVGERGIGKSNLLERVESAASDRGFRVLSATAHDDVSTPYQAIRDALPASIADGLFEGTAVDYDDGDFEERRTGLFFAVTDALASIVEDGPALLVVDDLHEAGRDTRALLDHLAEHRPDGLVLVGALRSEAVEGTGTDALAAMPEAERVDIRVEPLDVGATRELVATLLGSQEVPRGFLEDLHELTGGNPLFVEETVATLREAGRVDPSAGLYPESGADLPIADRVQTTIANRVERLDGTARDLIEHGAVIGAVVPLDVLEAAVSHDRSTIREYVDLLVDTRFWTRDEDGPMFASDVVRNVVLDRLDETRRRELHEHVADAYARLDDDGTDADARPDADARSDADASARRATDADARSDADASARRATDADARSDADAYASGDTDAEGDARRVGRGDSDEFAVARHAERAGDDRRALEAYRAAGDRAIGVYAIETALEAYERALRLARSLDSEPDLVALLDDIATLHSTAGNYDEADKYLSFLRESTDDPDLHRRSYRLQAEMRYSEGDYDAGLEAAERGLEVGEDATEETVRLYGVSGWIEMLQGDTDAALDAFQHQLEIADDLDDDRQRADATHTLASVAFMRGDVDTAIDREREAIAARRSHDEDRRLAGSYNNLGVMYLRAGDLEDARAAIERSVELAATVGDPLSRVHHEGNLAYCLERQGEWDRALDLYAETLETARTLGARPTIGFALGYGSVIRIYRGDLRVARERLEEALDVNQSIDHMRQLAMVRNKLAWLETLSGAVDAAADHAERAREVAAGEEPEWIAEARLRLARTSTARGDDRAAIEHYEAGLETARECGSAAMQVANAAGLGGTLAAVGDLDRGLDRTTDAVERAQAIGEPALIATARRSLGRCLRLADRPGAVDELDAALDIAADLEAMLLECRTLLERGRLVDADGDGDAQQRADLQRARDLAAEMGADLLERQAADELGRFDSVEK